MDDLAGKTAYGSAEWRRQRSGARLGLAGIGLLILAFPLWEMRDFIPTLASKRVVSIATVSTLHEGTEAQLQPRFPPAKTISSWFRTIPRSRLRTR